MISELPSPPASSSLGHLSPYSLAGGFAASAPAGVFSQLTRLTVAAASGGQGSLGPDAAAGWSLMGGGGQQQTEPPGNPRAVVRGKPRGRPRGRPPLTLVGGGSEDGVGDRSDLNGGATKLLASFGGDGEPITQVGWSMGDDQEMGGEGGKGGSRMHMPPTPSINTMIRASCRSGDKPVRRSPLITALRGRMMSTCM